MALNAGDSAPDFQLENHRREPVRLSDFHGRRHVVLAFHPLAWTPVCADQMSSCQHALDRLAALDAVVLGISADSTAAKAAWAEKLGLGFDLLSDFYPHGEVSRRYGVLLPEGFPQRAVFVVDKQGRIAYVRTYAMPDRPELDDVFDVLQALQTGRTSQPASKTGP